MNSQTKQIGLIAAGVSILLVVVWWLALMSPQGHKLAKAHKAHSAAEQQISSLQGQVSQLQALVKQEPQDQAALVTLKKAVPDNPELDAALNQLQDAADQAGVTMTSISPSTPATGAAASHPSSGGSAAPVVTLSVSSSGTYQQVTAFITHLDNLPRTFVVTGVNMSGSGQKLAVQLGISIFYAGQPTP